MELCYIFTAVSAILVALFLVVRVTKGGPLGVVTKALASFSFLALALIGASENGFTTFALFIILGLICGLIGDIVLDNKVVYKEHENTYLNAGILSFGIGHIFYFVAATIVAVIINEATGTSFSTISMLISLGVSVVLSSIIMMLAKPLKLDFGKFFYQSLAYSLALTFMASYSIFLAVKITCLWTFAVGMALFFISDLILSTQYFGGKQDNKLLIVLNHATYYAAQILIAITLFLI